MTIIEPNEEPFRKAVEPVYAKHGERFGALLQAIRDTK
jgi:TRAP-type C4-dicarboxylate transport system substrate-binding protein